MSYSNGFQTQYTIAGFDFTTAAVELAGIVGGGGDKTGRIAYVAIDVTTAIDAECEITFGPTGGTVDEYGSFVVSPAAVGDQAGGDGIQLPAGGPHRIPGGVGAGTWDISSNGAAGTGVGNVTIVVEWS